MFIFFSTQFVKNNISSNKKTPINIIFKCAIGAFQTIKFIFILLQQNLFLEELLWETGYYFLNECAYANLLQIP